MCGCLLKTILNYWFENAASLYCVRHDRRMYNEVLNNREIHRLLIVLAYRHWVYFNRRLIMQRHGFCENMLVLFFMLGNFLCWLCLILLIFLRYFRQMCFFVARLPCVKLHIWKEVGHSFLTTLKLIILTFLWVLTSTMTKVSFTCKLKIKDYFAIRCCCLCLFFFKFLETFSSIQKNLIQFFFFFFTLQSTVDS
jgi:hypothetical protein